MNNLSRLSVVLINACSSRKTKSPRHGQFTATKKSSSLLVLFSVLLCFRYQASGHQMSLNHSTSRSRLISLALDTICRIILWYMLTIIVNTSLDTMAQILTTSDRNSSYFRSDEIVDDVYDEVAREYIQNRTGELEQMYKSYSI
jgi:hypothetical protein